MWRCGYHLKTAFVVLMSVLATLLFCECLIHLLAASQCDWPQLEVDTWGYDDSSTLSIMMLSDPHLLGDVKGHWFDKLRREWQMQQAYKRVNERLRPQHVFILGDLFDEGQWIGDEDTFHRYHDRFKRLFTEPLAPTQKMKVVLGNHDVGFHYAFRASLYEYLSQAFNASSAGVELVVIKSNLFVLVTSMAMENDGCALCDRAQVELRRINKTLDCLQSEGRRNPTQTCVDLRARGIGYTRPILIQHFPLYRESDANCDEPDGATDKLKTGRMRENWECLSKNSTIQLLEAVRPRLAFDGHSHFGCRTNWPAYDMTEWTLASFSWRNINTPSVLLLRLNKQNYAVAKCLLAKESTVILCYSVILLFIILYFIKQLIIRYKTYRSRVAHKDKCMVD